MLPDASQNLGELPVATASGRPQALTQFLTDSFTTSLLVVHAGKVAYEWSFRASGLTDVLPCYSITKSVLGVVAGALIERGDLDPDRGAVTYVPELGGGGYRGVTVRDLLDMRTGGDYRETHDSDGELANLVKSRSQEPGAPFESVHDMVSRIERVGRHDGPFAYRSLDTEALGWVIERATGTAMDLLAEEIVLGPLGCVAAMFTKDSHGQVAHSGGLWMRPVDVARFGLMILNSGAVGDHQIVSPFFVKDLRAGNRFDANASSGGSYRNQFWVPQRGGRELLALGIHGQMLWMDAASDTVFVKLSAWPQPSDPALLSTTYAVARACAAALGGGPAGDITLRR
ncbi:MAG: serine hydrolase [Ornithinimicrobium sp.]